MERKKQPDIAQIDPILNKLKFIQNHMSKKRQQQKQTRI